MLEKTFFMIKPDGVARGLEDKIFNLIEAADLTIVQKRLLWLTEAEAAELYTPHLGKAFYLGLVRFITSGPVVISLIQGEEAIDRVRQLMGATDPDKAETGTIRHDFKESPTTTADGILKNVVHGSDSAEAAEREGGLFFQ